MSNSERDFEEIFNACYEPVRCYAARRVPGEAVQDVVSETFLVAWRRRGELHGEALPWLLGIARRVCSTQRRGSARREALRARLLAEPTTPGACAESGIEGNVPVETATAGGAVGACDSQLAQALASLRDRDREALMLVAWDGLDHRTAASAMGCTTGSLTVRLHRARRRLARALAAEGAESIGLCEEASAAS